jgi:hypothetical protein
MPPKPFQSWETALSRARTRFGVTDGWFACTPGTDDQNERPRTELVGALTQARMTAAPAGNAFRSTVE